MQASVSSPPSRFTREFISADQTITAAALLQFAHGLGVAPKLVRTRLVCATAEFGYNIGSIIDVAPGAHDALAASRGFALAFNTADVFIRYASGANTFAAPNFTTAVVTALTNANWRLRVMCWA